MLVHRYGRGRHRVFLGAIDVQRGPLKMNRGNFPIASIGARAIGVIAALMAVGCGLAYTTGTAIRARRMASWLQPGQSTIEVHNKWGEPDIRNESANTQVWSYAEYANSNDVTAELLYT